MAGPSFFQIIVLIAFIALAVIGVTLFALGIGPSWRDEIGPVVIWGTLPKDKMEALLTYLREQDDRFAAVSYVEMDPRTYDTQFVDALAAGRGPDLFLLTDQNLYFHRDKIIYIPFDTYSERDFKDTFIEGSEVFVTAQGIAALPLVVDPLVMYWNRDIFTDVSLSNPPRYWDEFFTLAPRVTQRDAARNIVRSFVAFGEYRNIDQAKDIISTLILQTGNPVVAQSEVGGYRSSLLNTLNYATPPAEAALRFYTEFSNPTKVVYSWNRALPSARHSFLRGDLALYFDFASEYSLLKSGNPNLNFDIAQFPESRDSERRTTLGHVTALALPRGTQNASGALTVAYALTSDIYVKYLAELLALPPARRDLLGSIPQDPAQAVFYESAIAARSWLDPAPLATEGVFQRLIDTVLSGEKLLFEALRTADEEMNLLLGN